MEALAVLLAALFTIFNDSSPLDPINFPSVDLGRVRSAEELIGGAGAKLALGVTVIELLLVLLLEFAGALELPAALPLPGVLELLELLGALAFAGPLVLAGALELLGLLELLELLGGKVLLPDEELAGKLLFPIEELLGEVPFMVEFVLLS